MKQFFLVKILLFVTSLGFSQVGINTTNPTKDLDINGELRIRNLPVQTGDFLLGADHDGNIGKTSVFLISDINSIAASQNVDITISPNQAKTLDNIDLGLSLPVTIPANREAMVIISYSVPMGLSTFSSPRGYYGIRFLRDGTEAEVGSRKHTVMDRPNNSNMVSVSNIYTEKFASSPIERIINYTLNGYIEHFSSDISNTYRFNMWSPDPLVHNYNWGKAVISKQVYLK
ncbi:MAG TPA: hypothetical protein VKX40_09040 [Aequorivita sp.]|nr:hypothetical protein [Aequorivita sp.]